ncbi:hypothetical protein [Gordonia hongkongensis]|uniref:hypothetical protein n=1 Tax=Gordonia hongkongensis TaxID=1701090 RepID=UPI003EBDC3A9
MPNPSWIELVGRNFAAGTLYLSGRLSVTLDGAEEHFRFWHGPGGQWRIESGDDVVYVRASGQAPIVRVGGHMQRVYRPVKLGAAARSPLDLFGVHTLLANRSQSLEVRSEPVSVMVEGRAGWLTELGSEGATSAISAVIDDATGVLCRYEAARIVLVVSELAEHESLPAGRFAWTGPVAAEDPGGDNSPAAKAARRLRQHETTAARVAALDQPFEVLHTILQAGDGVQARAALRELLHVSEFGADAVESMPLRLFNPEYANKIRTQSKLADG